MKVTKINLLLVIILVLLLGATVAYAYVGPELGSRTLSYGMVGGDVQQLQGFLNNHGYNVGYADGIFGLKTKNGVIRFQGDNGLAADGIVGSQTLNVINKITSSTVAKYTVKPGDTLYLIAVQNGITVSQLRDANNLQSDTLYPGQTLVIPKGQASPGGNSPAPASKSLAQILNEKGISRNIPNLRIVVDKSAHLLTLYSGTTALKSYRVALGDSGLGDKQRAGDHKTPEGKFYIAERSVLSPADQYLGTRWMRLSYPNLEDAQRGLNSGIIDQATYQQIVNANKNKQVPPQNTALGGGVGIHGGDENGTNTGDSWTYGCVALTNSDVNEIFDYIPVGTEVNIGY